MSKKTIGYILIVLGVAIVVISLAADLLGIGNSMGYGWKQLLGAAIGIVVAIVGVWLGMGKSTQKP
jgi:uncharacterized membrane protein YccC